MKKHVYLLIITIITIGFFSCSQPETNQAIINGDLETLRILIAEGADIHSTDTFNRSLIHIAAEEGQIDILKYLVSEGADINSGLEKGYPPLYYAVGCRKETSFEMVQYLVDRGAEVNLPPTGEWNARPESPLHRACIEGHVETVQFLIDMGADVNAITENSMITSLDGWTPFLAAADQGQLEICRLLKESGSNIYAIDSKGRGALHHAVVWDNVKLVEQFLEWGLDPEILDTEGWTPLDLAQENGSKESAKLLKDR